MGKLRQSWRRTWHDRRLTFGPTPNTARIPASTAVSIAVRTDIQVYAGVFVSLWTMRLGPVALSTYPGSIRAGHVLLRGYQLGVFRTHTALVTAEMIRLKARRNGSLDELVEDAVG